MEGCLHERNSSDKCEINAKLNANARLMQKCETLQRVSHVIWNALKANHFTEFFCNLRNARLECQRQSNKLFVMS